MLRAVIAGLVLIVASPASALADPCAGTGFYAGVARYADGTHAEVTVNLMCDGGQFKAQFFTPAGDFDSSVAAVAGDHFTATLDTGSALGQVDLKRTGDQLAGAFDVGGDKGTLTLTRRGDALAADAMAPRLDLTPAQWREDVRALAVGLPKLHANAFFSLSRAEFDAEVAVLDRRAASANGDEMWVGLQQIAKSIGDGHTGVNAPADRAVMPIEAARFGDDIRITAVGPGLGAALGARIVKIGGTPINKVWARVLTLTAREELAPLREGDALIYLTRGYALHGLDVTPIRNRALYTVRGESGRLFDVDVAALAKGATAAMISDAAQKPLRFEEPQSAFWCKVLPAARALYCGWRAYEDLPAKARAMFATVDSARPAKLIIGMRDNGGGDNTVGYAALIKPIEARADLNVRGRLYILVGPLTFSAAMNNAAQFQDETKAILAGQTIGERPNSYQEPRQFRLPHSHLVVRASTLWYAFRKTGPNVVAPEKEIVPTWDDVRNGRDPVLDWVLAQPARPRS
jgi:hypothetical protein